MQETGSDFAAVQKDWLEQLEKFVADFPDAEDAPDALSQMALGKEFAGNEDPARKYYEKLTEAFPNSGRRPAEAGTRPQAACAPRN